MASAEDRSPEPHDLVANVLARWPATARIFTGLRMGCVGCAMAPFVTLTEAVETYCLDPEDLLGRLTAAIDDTREVNRGAPATCHTAQLRKGPT